MNIYPGGFFWRRPQRFCCCCCCCCNADNAWGMWGAVHHTVVLKRKAAHLLGIEGLRPVIQRQLWLALFCTFLLHPCILFRARLHESCFFILTIRAALRRHFICYCFFRGQLRAAHHITGNKVHPLLVRSGRLHSKHSIHFRPSEQTRKQKTVTAKWTSLFLLCSSSLKNTNCKKNTLKKIKASPLQLCNKCIGTADGALQHVSQNTSYLYNKV